MKINFGLKATISDGRQNPRRYKYAELLEKHKREECKPYKCLEIAIPSTQTREIRQDNEYRSTKQQLLNNFNRTLLTPKKGVRGRLLQQHKKSRKQEGRYAIQSFNLILPRKETKS